ncbi:Interferon-Induced Protein With Tetratricopeptide Repeats 1 [Manis pentadactyla]|nr:Interferon-Induced Protein With Tetratricopeptide Repeats 1 [Manis pentadactyla]
MDPEGIWKMVTSGPRTRNPAQVRNLLEDPMGFPKKEVGNLLGSTATRLHFTWFLSQDQDKVPTGLCPGTGSSHRSHPWLALALLLILHTASLGNLGS